MNEKIMTASKVGFPCDRNIYYAVNGFKGEVKTWARLLSP